MAKFRKKPVVVEAVKLEQNLQSIQEVYFFMKWFDFRTQELKKKGIIIPTLEGEHLASWGDWIIKGVEGEFYPCKPDIFVKTYEPAED